ncbi:hypothetical protein [Microvirga roseola]|uniref:hypothetical protein n=1 Tax=Microvirga roseola TaxID=2883126 RepID=UPI001E4D0A97|nr:hypothetical protein [Microvirga roseola]
MLIGLALAILSGWGSAVWAQDFQSLPPGPGRDETIAWCSGCHSMALVTQQGMSRSRWDDTITWMVENQNMPEPTEEERKVLLDYLASHFGEAKSGDGCIETPWGRRCP